MTHRQNKSMSPSLPRPLAVLFLLAAEARRPGALPQAAHGARRHPRPRPGRGAAAFVPPSSTAAASPARERPFPARPPFALRCAVRDAAAGEDHPDAAPGTPPPAAAGPPEGPAARDDAYFAQMFDRLARPAAARATEDEGRVKLVDFIEEAVGIHRKKVHYRAPATTATTEASAAEGGGEERQRKATAKEEVADANDGGEGGSEGRKPPPMDEEQRFYCSQRGISAEKGVELIRGRTEAADAGEEGDKGGEERRPASRRAPSSTHGRAADPAPASTVAASMEEQPPPSVREKKEAPYNVVCTHITADFDTLASAIGLAKLWSLGIYNEVQRTEENNSTSTELVKEQVVHGPLPTYVVLPRGAHPDVQRFLSLHKHLFPIRSLKSLPGFTDNELKKKGKKGRDGSNPHEGLQRVGLVDAQRRDRLGPADVLLPHAQLGVTIVDHHVDAESDIQEARHYVVEDVGSVSTIIAERLKNSGVVPTEAEATILALGIHSDTGGLVYDSTTPKDATMLGWAMGMGASQTAIAEHAKPTLSAEQQGVLTQALMNINSTSVHGVTISTVLLSADGFIPGLASVTKDALDLSSSDIFLLAVCYEATRGAKGGGGGGGGGNRKSGNNSKKNAGGKGDDTSSHDVSERLQQVKRKTVKALSGFGISDFVVPGVGGGLGSGPDMINSESWKGGQSAFQRQRLAATFAFYDTDRSGFLDKGEVTQVLNSAGVLVSEENFKSLMRSIDKNGDGRIDFEEFVHFCTDMEEERKWDTLRETFTPAPSTPSTMTIIGRVKAGVNVRNVNLNTLFQQFNGGGHPKAASATAKLEDESDAKDVLQGLVQTLIDTSLEQQLTVGDFMQSPVLSAKPTMTERQVEDLFTRYDVRSLPVVDDNNEVIGMVSHKEVVAALTRLANKREKRLRQLEKAAAEGKPVPQARPLEGSPLKGWMKQHVQTVPASLTMAEAESVLLETDVGCIPVVADGTRQLIGMVTRTDLLRQHHYYSSLHYHNKGFSDSIAARKPIIELRKKLKKFDIENE